MRWTIASAYGAGVVLSLVLGLGVWAGGGRRNAFTGRPFLHDQIPFHAAGLACRSGDCAALYDEASQRAWQQVSFGPGDPAHYRPFVAPPHTALLYVPASLLPFPAFAFAAAAANLALLFLALRMAGAGPASIVAAFGFYPVFDGFGVGQNVFLTLFLFAAALRLWRAERGFLAGLVAGLVAAYKPHLACGVAALWLLEARRDPRPLFGLLAALVAYAAIDVTFLLPQLRAYAGSMTGVLAGDKPLWAGITAAGEFTVREMFALLLPAHETLAAALAVAGQLAGAAAFAIFWARHRGDRPLAYAAALLLTLWLIPHAHRYEWTLLVLPGLIAWSELPDARPRLLALYAGFYAVSALAIRVARWQLDAFGVALHPAIPALALGACALIVSSRPGSTRRAPRSGARRGSRGRARAAASGCAGCSRDWR